MLILIVPPGCLLKRTTNGGHISPAKFHPVRCHAQRARHVPLSCLPEWAVYQKCDFKQFG